MQSPPSVSAPCGPRGGRGDGKVAPKIKGIKLYIPMRRNRGNIVSEGAILIPLGTTEKSYLYFICYISFPLVVFVGRKLETNFKHVLNGCHSFTFLSLFAGVLLFSH